MASGLVRRANRPNTWLHRPACKREENPCQLGAAHTWHLAPFEESGDGCLRTPRILFFLMAAQAIRPFPGFLLPWSRPPASLPPRRRQTACRSRRRRIRGVDTLVSKL